jgi:HAD superfamily hydrolase (TIGR01509 family)
MLVIFDCDGVLVDSEPLSNAALAEALRGVGLDFSVERTTTEFKGRSWASCEARIAELLGRPAPPELQRDYEARRDAAFAGALRVVPGIEAALDALDGTATCVASSGSHAKMRLTLGLTGLLERFEGRMFSATEVANGKPAPDLFLHAAASMGAEPARCAVVEDSLYGVMAARAAGMRAFGYAGGLTRPERLEGHGTTVFDDMRELPRLLADGSA